MLLTTPIKLIVSQTEKQSLLQTMYTFNSACNMISEYAFANRCFGQYKLHKAVYHDVRKRFPSLPAQFVIRSIARVSATYKTDKTVQHRFQKHSSMDFDARVLSFGKNLDTVSLASIDGRIKQIPIVFGTYFNLFNRKLHSAATLIFENGNLFLNAITEVAEEEQLVQTDFIGMDSGIVNLATLDNGTRFVGDEVEHVRQRYLHLRKRLQCCNTKSAKRHLKRISKQEGRFKKNTNHIISKRIVSKAKRHNVGIAIEDLQSFKKTVRKSERDRHGKWAFHQLMLFIIYKAAILGVPVARVDPRYTSQTCSCCGHCEKANRKGEAFCCKRCGFAANADVNAAINIKNRAISAINLLNGFATVLSWAVVNQPIAASNIQYPSLAFVSGDRLENGNSGEPQVLSKINL